MTDILGGGERPRIEFKGKVRDCEGHCSQTEPKADNSGLQCALCHYGRCDS